MNLTDLMPQIKHDLQPNINNLHTFLAHYTQPQYKLIRDTWEIKLQVQTMLFATNDSAGFVYPILDQLLLPCPLLCTPLSPLSLPLPLFV